MQPALSDKYLLEEILKLKEKFNSNAFFETGTWKGYSASIISKFFYKVYSYENNKSFFDEAVRINQDNKNVILKLENSVDGLKRDLTKENNKDIFFLDAHWDEYFPLLDELKVIKDKKIKPIILIHDFFTPDGNGKSKFHYDTYGEKSIGFLLVKEIIEEIYEGKFIHYCLENSEINSGVGVFYEDENANS